MRMRTVWVFALLSLACALVYWPTFELRPLSGDNIYILAWSDASPASALWGLDPRIYPEWRPLAFLSIWLEHRVVSLDLVTVHFAVNLLLWAACGTLVYLTVSTLTGSAGAGIAAALFLVTDTRAMYTQAWIIERQTSMACGFGLAALYVICRAGPGPLGRRAVIATALLLLASSLSKEYGLAFTAAMLTYAAWQNRTDLAWASGVAAVAYAALRLSAGGALGPYCEDMAYFDNFRYTCLSPTSVDTFLQVGYNMAAAGVGMLFQGLLSEEGLLHPERLRVVIAALLLLPTLHGIVRGPAPLKVVALVVVFAAALNLMVYRDRNHLVGASAIAVAMGVGFAMADRLGRGRSALRYAAWGLLAVMLLFQATRTRTAVAREVENLLVGRDPCTSLVMTRRFGPPFVAKVKRAYSMDNPACADD